MLIPFINLEPNNRTYLTELVYVRVHIGVFITGMKQRKTFKTGTPSAMPWNMQLWVVDYPYYHYTQCG